MTKDSPWGGDVLDVGWAEGPGIVMVTENKKYLEDEQSYAL